jgi:hypothetical protein
MTVTFKKSYVIADMRVFHPGGQHMLHTSARQVSRYLATLAIQKLGPKQDGSSYDNSLLHSA